MRASRYPVADCVKQWFADDFPGAIFTSLDKVVLHTTEGAWWPDYAGGMTAPNFTMRPNVSRKVVEWRQHFPTNMSSRALENKTGGVETNRAKAVQVELVGTCAMGGPGLYWPGAPDWALIGVANFLRWMNMAWGVPLLTPDHWLSYPESYGRTRARLTNEAWKNFRGVCGHQHVPENDHGDPGALPIGRILKMAGTRTVPQQKGKTLAEWTEQELRKIISDEVNGLKDEIAAEVWNRFAVHLEAGGLLNPLRAIEAIMNSRNDPTELTDATVDRIAERVKCILQG